MNSIASIDAMNHDGSSDGSISTSAYEPCVFEEDDDDENENENENDEDGAKYAGSTAIQEMSTCKRLTFVQALYRASCTTRRVPEVIHALGFRSKSLQVAMRTESAFVEVVLASRGCSMSCDLSPEAREDVIRILNEASIPAELLAISALHRGIGRGAINIVEFDTDGCGFGCIVDPFGPPLMTCASTPFALEKELAEVYSLECSAVFFGKNVKKLGDAVVAQMQRTRELSELIDAGDAVLVESVAKLAAVRDVRKSIAIQTGEVELSIKIAESRLRQLDALRDRLKADAETRLAENAVTFYPRGGGLFRAPPRAKA